MTPHSSLTAAKIIETIAELRSSGIALPMPSAQAVLEETLVVRLPDWVAGSGLLRDEAHFWLYCLPTPGAVAEAAGQILIHLPPGRYLIDTFNTATRTCVARESAAGNPLVAGLVYAPEPVLLWIRPPTLIP